MEAVAGQTREKEKTFALSAGGCLAPSLGLTATSHQSSAQASFCFTTCPCDACPLFVDCAAKCDAWWEWWYRGERWL